jgi:phage terminase large subunit-like protein
LGLNEQEFLKKIRRYHFLSQWFPKRFKEELLSLSPKAMEAVIEELEYRQKFDKLSLYFPYGHPETLKIEGWSKKPWQLDFHNALERERMMMAANRVGKTQSSAPEVAMHMTGIYPDWWEGRRFKKPILVWTGSPTNETSRDIVQKALLGGVTKEDLGSGWIPKESLHGKPKNKQAGISDVVDLFRVKHISGGVSTCILKTYEQGWRKWQGTEPEVVWMDEEPEDNELQGKIYSEALTRLLTSNGIMLVTFTPLLGVTKLVEHFQQGGESIYLDTATWDDAPHLDPKAKQELSASYQDFEREARTLGVPMMGEGRVFTTPEEELKIEPFEIPPYFARIKGIDFGIDHPAAVVDLAWDRDKDVIYVTRVWRKKGAKSEEHARAITDKTPWIPVAWPHDGTNREKSNGIRLKDNYKPYGVKFLSMSARYDNEVGGSQRTEPIVQEFDDRCRDGEIRVFSDCPEFFDEYRNYHRKGGQLTKTRDDVLKACFYGLMMKRFAKTRHSRVIKNNMPRPITV